MGTRPIIIELANGLVNIRIEPNRPTYIGAFEAFDNTEVKEWQEIPDDEVIALHDALRAWYDARRDGPR